MPQCSRVVCYKAILIFDRQLTVAYLLGSSITKQPTPLDKVDVAFRLCNIYISSIVDLLIRVDRMSHSL